MGQEEVIKFLVQNQIQVQIQELFEEFHNVVRM